MGLWTRFARAPQARIAPASNVNDLTNAGSWLAFTVASIAACALIFSAAAQNIAHGYALGLASSEFRAIVLAAASAGASILGPCAWLAVVRGQGVGTRAIALVLALGCLAYAATCSLGFVAGSRDLGVSERVAAADAYAEKRALAKAARDELATLKGTRADVVERRAELTSLLASLATAKPGERPVEADSQAAGITFVLAAAGWRVSVQDVAKWLNVGTVLFLEAAAALSLTVAAALRPVRGETLLEALPAAVSAQGPDVPARPEKPASASPARRERDDKDDPGSSRDDPRPPRPKPPRKGKVGRPPTVIPAQAIDRLRKAGGRANGSISSIGKVLGTRSKTTAHRLLHQLASAGAVQLATGPHGVSVALA
jgi:hypothetical protein